MPRSAEERASGFNVTGITRIIRNASGAEVAEALEELGYHPHTEETQQRLEETADLSTRLVQWFTDLAEPILLAGELADAVIAFLLEGELVGARTETPARAASLDLELAIRDIEMVIRTVTLHGYEHDIANISPLRSLPGRLDQIAGLLDTIAGGALSLLHETPELSREHGDIMEEVARAQEVLGEGLSRAAVQTHAAAAVRQPARGGPGDLNGV